MSLKLLLHLVLRQLRYVISRCKYGVLLLLNISADQSLVLILIFGGPFEDLVCGVLKDGFIRGPAVFYHCVNRVFICIEDPCGLKELCAFQLGSEVGLHF